MDKEVDFKTKATYFVRALDQNLLLDESHQVLPWATNYLSIPLRTPEGYTPNDASVGDLTGDGKYEIVIHMTGKDNSQKGFTDEPILHAYTLAGDFLWEINLGKNIREGANYTRFMVYAWMVTADGSRDGKNKVIGDPEADWRNEDGYILSSPEFLTVFDGETGAELATTAYVSGRHPKTENPTSDQMKEVWGDGYGTQVDRFLAGIAYLNGKRPSLIMSRGYYTRTVIAAWIWRDGDLLRELLDGVNIDKLDYENSTSVLIFSGEDYQVLKNNGTKSNPCLSADILGDWREELLGRSENGQELRIFSTTIPTEHRLYTLMHNTHYRLSLAWQNVAYNQPPHTDYFLGAGMEKPELPDIELTIPKTLSTAKNE